MRTVFFTALILFATLCDFSGAQETGAAASDTAPGLLLVDAAEEKRIMALRESLVNAVAEKDVEALLMHLHSDCELTVQDGQDLRVIRKHEGIREYFERLFKGDQASLKSVRANITVDEILQLSNGDVALANGASDDHFVMRSGGEYDLKNRWSATVVDEAGSWKLLSLHVSSNLFDNPIYNAATSSLFRVGSMGLLIGLVIGLLFAKLFSGRRAA